MNGAGTHNQELRRVLQSLAQLEPGSPVVSAYLDTRWSDEHQRERVRLTVKDRVRNLKAAYEGHRHETSVVASLDRLERFVADVVNQASADMVSTAGLAIFGSVDRELWTVFQSTLPFDNEVSLSDRPRLLPLARLHDDYESAIVVLADPRRLRIFEVFLGGVVTSAELAQYVPDRVDVGGPGHRARNGLPRGGALSQMRYQRHIEEHREQNLRNAGDFLRRMLDQESAAHVILAGDDETVAAFASVLPTQVKDRVIAETRLDDKEAEHKVVARALEILARHEADTEQEGVEEVVGLAMAGNLGVLGPEDTLMALNEERVYRLFLHGDHDFGPGWCCTTCNALGRKAEAGCPYCGGDTTTIDLAEEMVRRAIGQGAQVEHVKRSPRLSHFGGMGALLRHGRRPLDAGLAHAEHYPLPVE